MENCRNKIKSCLAVDFGVLPCHDRPDRGKRCDRQAHRRLSPHTVDAADSVAGPKHVVHTVLTPNEQRDCKTSGQCKGKPHNSNGRKNLVPKDIADGDFYRVCKDGFPSLCTGHLELRACSYEGFTRRSAPCPRRSAHSYRSASTGFAIAALIACVLTVRRAMSSDIPPASAKTHQPISTR